MRFATLMLLVLVSSAAVVRADGPADNHPDSVRRIPKLGVELPADKRQELETSLAELDAAIAAIFKNTKDQKIKDLLVDVRIYAEAVRTALTYQEFFDLKEVGAALELLAEGKERAKHLAEGRAPWTTQAGLVVRGYVSKIDGSVQPYGLVIPADYTPGPHRYRLDFWFHGRGETLSEVNFLQQRRKQVGQFVPADTIVLHPYGRYSNANKFAGETDVYEALASVKSRYKIDEDRISVRGFSMGGASTWHLAVHNPTMWAAANPGAGFSETPDFLKKFQNETLDPTWYERKLWHLYDCTDWSVNLLHCPTVAYSGEIDRQKQAADIMADALFEEGIELTHIIGPKTAHSYEANARDEVDRRMASIMRLGRMNYPQEIFFTTYTLKYNRCATIRVDALGEHWKKAFVTAAQPEIDGIELATDNVTAVTIDYAAGSNLFDALSTVLITIDGQEIEGPQQQTDGSFFAQLHLAGDEWKLGPAPSEGLVKRHGLQGPIDDAFMDSFIFVRPSGRCRSAVVDEWSKAELERAIEHWRRQFRGKAKVRLDKDVTDEDIASANLVLWGDDQANSVWARIADKLPLRYEGESLVVGSGAVERKFAAEHHAPIQIYPNPLNAERYVVTNSSFTFREYAYLNNARQVPMLPDWAVVDLRTKPDAVRPGKIAEADFFGEKWEVRATSDRQKADDRKNKQASTEMRRVQPIVKPVARTSRGG